MDNTYVIQLFDITFTYKTSTECYEFLKKLKNCNIKKDKKYVTINTINTVINNISYDYNGAIKKLTKIKSKEKIDLTDLDGYSDFTDNETETDSDKEDIDEYQKYESSACDSDDDVYGDID
jgi:hypothetical protein